MSDTQIILQWLAIIKKKDVTKSRVKKHKNIFFLTTFSKLVFHSNQMTSSKQHENFLSVYRNSLMLFIKTTCQTEQTIQIPDVYHFSWNIVVVYYCVHTYVVLPQLKIERKTNLCWLLLVLVPLFNCVCVSVCFYCWAFSLNSKRYMCVYLLFLS